MRSPMVPTPRLLSQPSWRSWRDRGHASPSPVLGRYTGSNIWREHRGLLFGLLIFAAFVYGLFFALFGQFLFLQMITPLAVMAAVVVWLLPETTKPPTNALGHLLIAFLIALLCWPDYLALALPGLPWITALRLTGIPMALIFMVCMSVSAEFRTTLMRSLNGAPWTWKMVLAFAVLAAISIAFSAEKGSSTSKFVIAQLNWTIVFFVSAYVFLKPGRVTTFGYMLWGIVVFVCLIAIQEARFEKLPWAGHIPSLLEIQDPAVQKIMSAKSRAATELYRAQSKFTTPLGLAEFLALSTPFVIHIALSAKRLWERAGALLTIPLIFYAVILTDSRLGAIGFFISLVLYVLLWGVMRWRLDRGGLLGPAVVMAFPALFACFVAAVLFIGRLRTILLGNGAQQFSNASRGEQYAAGIKKIIARPWGYGIGQGGEVLGFANPNGSMTIDTYYIAVALEYGVIGFFVFYSMIAMAIYYSAKNLLIAKQRDTLFLAPLVITMVNFFIIKSIFSQQENHPLIFLMLGMISALAYRTRLDAAGAGNRRELVRTY